MPRPLACCSPTTTTTHPLLATQGHASRLCMTARNISCHKCFPKASTFVTLSADKNLPTTPYRVCLSLFWMCQQFLAGWPDMASWRCLLHVCRCVCVHVNPCVFLYLLMYVWIYLRLFVFFYVNLGRKGHVILPQLNQELHTGEGCCSMVLPDHVNEVPWLCSHWSIIDLFVSYLPNRHSDPEHVYFAMRNVKKDWKFPQCAH